MGRQTAGDAEALRTLALCFSRRLWVMFAVYAWLGAWDLVVFLRNLWSSRLYLVIGRNI